MLRFRNRSLHFETLAARIALTGDVIADGPGGEGEDHIVQQAGNVVFVFGGDTSDLVELQMSDEQYSLTINGESHQFPAEAVDQIVIAGMGGEDEVNVTGSDLNDRIKVLADEIEMISQDYAVRVRSAELVRASGAGGFDTVRVFDSPGDDELFMHHDFAAFENEAGEAFRVSGVERVEAFADAGGLDRVSFYDSPDQDRFVAKEDFSYMVGDGFWNYARGYERVDAYHEEGGRDEARFYDSPEDDLLIARPHEVTLFSGSTIMMSHNYPVTRAFASQGNDTATLFGQAAVKDMFVWQPDSSYLYTTGIVSADAPDAIEPVVASNLAVGFDLVEAFGGDDADRAELRGSAGDDNYVALPQIVRLETPAATVQATDFRIVRAFGRGGQDRAHLEDSQFNDVFISNNVFAYMEGPDYLNYVSGFVIDAVARNGGFDYANAREYSGPNQDHLIFDGPQFLIWGPNRDERIVGFDDARGDGVLAGWSVIRGVEFNFTLGGSHDQNDVPSDEDAQIILDRSLEELNEYSYVDGQIVFSESD